MQNLRLDHVNVRTNSLQRMIDWYGKFLGLTSGPRPDFGFPGAWLYQEDRPVVHLVEVAEGGGAGTEQPLKLEHFAFIGESWPEFKQLLDEHDVKYAVNEVKDMCILQCNIWDPDQNHIHVDFALSGSQS